MRACVLGACERAFAVSVSCDPESFSQVFLLALHLVPNLVCFLFSAVCSLQFQLLKTLTKCSRKKNPANSNPVICSLGSKQRPIRLDERAAGCWVPGCCPGHQSPQAALGALLHFLQRARGTGQLTHQLLKPDNNSLGTAFTGE